MASTRPDLRFKSSPVTRSHLVCVDGVDISCYVPQHSDTESESSDSDTDINLSTSLALGESTERYMYHVARSIRHDIKNLPKGLMDWPPSIDQLNLQSSMKHVPIALYNLIALIAGASDDVPSPGTHVAVKSDKHKKRILSITQDIVTFSTRGKVMTPKSYACGMTLRHYNISKPTANLIAGYGHAAGYQSLLGLETAAAMANSDLKVPTGFATGAPTIVCMDNLDFSEETTSGAGTSHFVNGIMIQKQNRADRTIRQSGASIPKTLRTLPIQDKGIVPTTHTVKNRHGPESITFQPASSEEIEHVLAKGSVFDIAYLLVKLVNSNNATTATPNWKHFNQTCPSASDTGSVFKSAIHYMKPILAPATEINTINTILTNSLTIADMLQLPKLVLVFDQAIYTKIQELRWLNTDYTERFIVRMGEFHTMMSYMSIIGKRFESAGLADLLIESGVVAPGSINCVIAGKQYNRALRAFINVYEALSRLRMQASLESINEDEASKYQQMAELLSASYSRADGLDIENPILRQFTTAYQAYIDEHSNNLTFSFWSSYIDMVQLLLLFLRATRSSNWDLHLATIPKMLPWFFAYNRTNYCRYYRH